MTLDRAILVTEIESLRRERDLLLAERHRLVEALLHVRDRGCRLAKAEDVVHHGYVAVPHEEAVAAVKKVLNDIRTECREAR